MPELSGDDALIGLAPLLRVRPELDDLCHFGGAWASSHGAEQAGWAYFHIVIEGGAELDRPGSGPLRLKAGDVLLLPHGDAHTLRAPGSAGRPIPPVTTRLRHTFRVRTSVGTEADTELICGRLYFEAAPQSLIVAALPDVVVLRAGERPMASSFSPIVTGIREELNAGRPGATAIAKDLASALFMMLIRAHLETAEAAEGLLQLLNGRATAPAVLAMVRDPARAWTLDDLATIAHASRSTLVRAFQRTARTSPLTFLADLRLGLARHRLGGGTASLDQIAAEVGYRSQPAFSRAFLRKYGVRPGRVRHASRPPHASTRM